MVKNAVDKASEVNGKVNPRYTMTVKDMDDIYQAYGGNFEVIGCSFNFGYAQGMKAARAELKKGGAVNG